MSILLDLNPEIEARAQAQAQAQGIPVADYLQTLLGQVLPAAPQRAGMEEFARDLDLFSEGTEGLPPLSDEALSREAMYADHD